MRSERPEPVRVKERRRDLFARRYSKSTQLVRSIGDLGQSRQRPLDAALPHEVANEWRRTNVTVLENRLEETVAGDSAHGAAKVDSTPRFLQGDGSGRGSSCEAQEIAGLSKRPYLGDTLRLWL